MGRIGVILISSVSLVGCAKSSSDIQATYISPVTYESYSCRQLQEEAGRVSARASQVAGVQDDNARNDAIATTAGAIVFWPALFMVKGNGETAAEVGRLKGEMDAVEQASIQKKCGINFRRA